VSEQAQVTKLISAINYRQNIAQAAEKLLDKLWVPVNHAYEYATTLDILVVGAGTFPSYISLLNVFSRKMPRLQTVHFSLVEPLETETAFFKKHFENFLKSEKTPQVDVTVYNQQIQDFLLSPPNAVFDLVYFEHPEIMTLPIMLSRLGLSRFKRSTALRESIPFLANIFKPGAWIIASCMSHHELGQMKSLLKFSLYSSIQWVHAPRLINYFYGGPYCSGLACVVKVDQVSIDAKQKISKAIRRSDNSLFGVLILSFIIYCIKFSKPYFFIEQLAAVLIMYAQLLFHRPGIKGFLLKFALLVALLTV
jgi:hypothetical protein